MQFIAGLFCGGVTAATMLISFAILRPARTKRFLWPRSFGSAVIYHQSGKTEIVTGRSHG